MKKFSFVSLLIAVLFSSCIHYDGTNKPTELTQQGQDIYSTWIQAIYDCIDTHACPAVIVKKYIASNLQGRQFIIDKYFQGLYIDSIRPDMWAVVRDSRKYKPCFEVLFESTHTTVKSFGMANYRHSDFDAEQNVIISSQVIDNSDGTYALTLSEPTSSDVSLTVDAEWNPVSGTGSIVVGDSDSYGSDDVYYISSSEPPSTRYTRMLIDYDITQPLVKAFRGFSSGEIILRAVASASVYETVKVHFDGNFADFTFKGYTERVYQQ
ncbi:MAG: hypothetical protein LBS16_02585 [Prevotellaceae bacterium]|nr:hypothetical protein [Prevotellaceae bacterium]